MPLCLIWDRQTAGTVPITMHGVDRGIVPFGPLIRGYINTDKTFVSVRWDVSKVDRYAAV